jgi:sugar O-acyltransferase (sialic acid O-acetyltransferase NeuD family)
MTKIWLVGSRSNFFDDFRDVAEEASPTDTELIDLDNLGLALVQPGAWIENLATREQVRFFIPVPGTPAIRQAIHKEFSAAGLEMFRPLVHPSSSVSTTMTIGAGSIISRLVSAGFGASIGNGCHVNRSASLGHHCVVENFVTVGPSATILGGARLGRGSFIGAGSVVLPHVSVGEFAVVGAGAVVTKDVEEGAVVIGNPAKVNPKEQSTNSKAGDGS